MMRAFYTPLMKQNIYCCVFLFFLILSGCRPPQVQSSDTVSFAAQADTLFRQAAARQQAQDYAAAISLYGELLGMMPPPDGEAKTVAPLVNEALMQMMYCHFFSGEQGSAAAYYTALYADYGIAGAVYNQTGNIPEAIRYTEKCAAILRTLDDKTDLVNALGNLIYQYQQVGNFDRSLAAYEELIALPEVKANAYHRCVAEVNIISLFDEWGLEEEVAKHLEAARRAAAECSVPEARLRCLLFYRQSPGGKGTDGRGHRRL